MSKLRGPGALHFVFFVLGSVSRCSPSARGPRWDAKSPGRAALLIEVGSKEPCCSLRFWVRWEANSRGGGAAALEFWAREGKEPGEGLQPLFFWVRWEAKKPGYAAAQ